MRIDLKPLSEQVVVITGASSGIGLATAKKAAKAGAKVVLAARDGTALAAVAADIVTEGGQAEAVEADVSIEADVRRILEQAVTRFGRIDTWINNAGIGFLGELKDTPFADHEQIFQTNYFGTVYGATLAVEQMRKQAAPGAVINIGSEVSDLAMPYNGAYVATKHAIKGFTDVLRIELMHDQVPIAVTLIKPSAIDTSFFEHAKSAMGAQMKPPEPTYAPEVVAAAILHAAQHPRREIPVGASATFVGAMYRHAPGMMSRLLATLPKSMFVYADRAPPSQTSVDPMPPPEGREKSGNRTPRPFSLTTTAQTHPAATIGAFALAGAAAAMALRQRGRRVQ